MNAFLAKFRRWLLMFVNRYGLGAPSAILPAAGGAAAATGGIIAAAVPSLALAGPIGAAVGGVLALLGVLGVGGGCGQSCITASNDANAIEAALKANLQAFLSGNIDQATALANFNSLWRLQLQQACAQVGGSAGENCISDRQAGACKWTTSPGGWQPQSDGSFQYVAPGPAGSGDACWNWDLAYRQSIADAPQSALPGSGFSIGNLAPWLAFGAVGLILAEVF